MEKDIEVLQQVLKEDPSNFQARRELSILLADMGFNEEALSNIKYLLKYFPQDSELYYNLGILQEKLKDFKNAKIAYKEAIALSPQEDYYYNLGEVLISLKEWEEAIEAFRTVLKTDPNDGNCYFNLGLCYFNKDEMNLATDNFQKAINLNPNDLYAHFYLGNIYQNNGLTNFAIASYEKVLEISPDYSWAYYNLASIAFKNNDLELAKDYLLKTIHYNETDIEAYKLLTKICIRNSEFEEIITILETRLANETNGDLYYTLAQVYKYVQKDENYINALQKALDNKLTLTYPRDIIGKELEYVTQATGFDKDKLEINEYETQEEFEYEEDSDENYDDEEDL